MNTLKLIFSMAIAMLYIGSTHSADSDPSFGGSSGGEAGSSRRTGKGSVKRLCPGDSIPKPPAVTSGPGLDNTQSSRFTFTRKQKIVYASTTNPITGEEGYACTVHTAKTMGYCGPESDRLRNAKTAKLHAEAEVMVVFAQALAAHLASPARLINPKAEPILKMLRDSIDIKYPRSPFSFDLSDTPPTTGKPA